MPRRSDAASIVVSVRPTDTASVAELIPSSSGFSAPQTGSGGPKGLLPLQLHEGVKDCKTSWLCSTRPQNFSNARDSGLLGLFMPALLLADQLCDRPEGGGELGRRVV